MSATNTFEIVSSDNLPFWISNIPDIQVRKQYITPVSDTNDFKTISNQSITSYGQLNALAPELEWVDNYCKIKINDQTKGQGRHEIWGSVDNGNYKLITVLGRSNLVFNHVTFQNATLKYKIRASNGNSQSDYSDESSIVSPLVFKVVQSNPLVRFSIRIIRATAANKFVDIDWGDGTSNNYGITNILQHVIFHDYSSAGTYYVKISGDVDWIWHLRTDVNASPARGTDVSKWRLPKLTTSNIEIVAFGASGDLSNWDFDGCIPTNISGIRLTNGNFIGNIINWDFSVKTSLRNLGIAGKSNTNNFVADISGWRFTPSIETLWIGNNTFSGDISDWPYMPNLVQMHMSDEEQRQTVTLNVNNWSFSPKLYSFRADNALLSGNLNHWEIGNNLAALADIRVRNKDQSDRVTDNSQVTGFPRGHFKQVYDFNFWGNHCGIEEVDNFLIYLDGYFTSNISVTNCVYTLNGPNMGIPTINGLNAIDSIKNKYIAAGRTATFHINS